MSRLKLSTPALALGLLVRCASGGPSAPAMTPPASATTGSAAAAVLFIGNSLTEANDLPRRVQDLSRDAGAPIEVEAVLGSGFSLEDHLATGRAVSRIHARSWSVVVLQQGPSTLPESRALLIRDARRLGDEIRAAGGRPALLEVWPLPGQRQEDVSASYTAAAAATGSLLLPAGDAWQAARERDRSLALTVGDGFHPSALGTYLAALTIHCTLNGGLPPAPSLAVERQRAGVAISEDQVRILRAAACAASGSGGP